MARPKKPPEERAQKVSLRLTREQREHIEQVSAQSGLSVGKSIALTIDNAIRSKKTAKRPIPKKKRPRSPRTARWERRAW